MHQNSFVRICYSANTTVDQAIQFVPESSITIFMGDLIERESIEVDLNSYSQNSNII